MKRICNFILLLCLVQLAVAQNRIAEIRENLLGNHPDKIFVFFFKQKTAYEMLRSLVGSARRRRRC